LVLQDHKVLLDNQVKQDQRDQRVGLDLEVLMVLRVIQDLQDRRDPVVRGEIEETVDCRVTLDHLDHPDLKDSQGT